MAGIQGKRFSEGQIARVRQLLRDTEMSIPEIATRMGCSKGPILSINRRFGIRQYLGKRSCWQTGSSQDSDNSSAIQISL
jgi:hypothetical protein